MQIRLKLTIQFISIVALILLAFSLSVYFFSADYRQDAFYNRLKSKAGSTAKLLLAVEEVDEDLLKKIEQNNPTSLPMEVVTIFNFRNKIIYNTDSTDALRTNSQLLDRIRLDGEVRYVTDDYEVLGFLFTDKYDRFVVIAGAVDIYGLNKLKNLRMVLLIAFCVSILLVIIFGWIYSGRALRPISSVIAQVDDITITSLNLRVDEGNGQDEIAMLASTFNNMLTRLESAFKMQKNFIANASHELRTPLTAIVGQLEVMLMKKRKEEEYIKVMTSVLDDMRNLSTVSNRLLLLAQANSETAALDFHPIRVDDLIWQATAELNKRFNHYKVNFVLDAGFDDEDKLMVNGNEQLIKTAILNLIENGCKYSPIHEVDVEMKVVENRMAIYFSDKGIGIYPDELSQVFEPFHRGRNAIHHKGHGLGLSLVKRIADLHGGEIRMESEPEVGTTCILYLPCK